MGDQPMTRSKLPTGLLIAGVLLAALAASALAVQAPRPASEATVPTSPDPTAAVSAGPAASPAPESVNDSTGGLVGGDDKFEAIPAGGVDLGTGDGSGDSTCPNREPCGP